MRRIFLVTGMRYSGTALLAKILSQLGLEPPISISTDNVNSDSENLESPEIASAQDKILSQMRTPWDSFHPVPTGWLNSEYAVHTEKILSSLIHKEFPGKGPILLEDFRSGLLLPLWDKIIKKQKLVDFYIISLRHPESVSKLLFTNYQIGRHRAYLIWLRYVLQVEEQTRGKKRIFIEFPFWTVDCLSLVKKLQSTLQVEFPNSYNGILAYIMQQFESQHIRYQPTDIAIFQDSPAAICYQNLQQLILNPDNQNAQHALDEFRKEFMRSAEWYGMASAEYDLKLESVYTQKITEKDSETERRNTADQEYISTLRKEQEELKKNLILKEQECIQIDCNREQLKRILEENQKDVTLLEQKCQDLEHRLGQKEQQNVQVQEAHQELTQSLASNRENIVLLEQTHQDLKQRLTEKEQQNIQVQKKYQELEQQFVEKEQQLVLNEEQITHAQDETSIAKDLLNNTRLQLQALDSEYNAITQLLRQERYTLLKPLYRNFYRTGRQFLRTILPSRIFESVRQRLPDADGFAKRYSKKRLTSLNFNTAFEKPDIYSKADIFVFSIINWEFRIQRPQHIARHLGLIGHRVFYVEMEMSTGSSSIISLAENVFRIRLNQDSIGHIQSYTGVPSRDQIKKWVETFFLLCSQVQATSFKEIIVQHPFWWQMVRALPPEFRITFDCMDEVSGFDNTNTFLLDLERDLLEKCDQLVVSSQYLYNKYQRIKTPTLIRNAGDIAHFDRQHNVFTAPDFLKPYLPDNNTLAVGYVGAIAHWFDADLVAALAESRKDTIFHLCGDVTSKEAQALDRYPNVHLYGEIAYNDVPAFLSHMDVLIIPFKIIPIIRACDPVKFYEYSAMGLPTVITPMPELDRVRHLAFVAMNAREFSNKIDQAARKGKKKSFASRLKKFAANNTWEQRVAVFEKMFEESTPKVSIVILAYGEPEFTNATIHSLYEDCQIYPNLEVIIVDNASPKESLQQVKNYCNGFNNIKIIENQQNLGFAGGNNVGIRAATGDYILLLNNDTYVTPGAIYSMVRHLQKKPSVGVVGPMTNNIGNEAKLHVEYEDMVQMKSVARQVTMGYRGMHTPIPVVAYFAVMFRAIDLEKFGLLSEEYGRGMFEDDDHCAAINALGYICALAEDAFVHHHLSGTFSQINADEKKALFEKNKAIYEGKWGVWQPHRYRQERPEGLL